MEPLTAVAVLAASYGARELVGAFSGQPELGGLAAELLSALAASEDQLSTQLAGIEDRLTSIEQRLDRVLEQRYETELGVGVRCLHDAATADLAADRLADLVQARQHFRTAAASATSALRRALAERYLLLCALALGRLDTARAAFEHMRVAMTEATFEIAADLHQSTSSLAGRYIQAPVKWFGFVERDARPFQPELDGILQSAKEAGRIIERLFAETAVLGEPLGLTVSAPLQALISTDPDLYAYPRVGAPTEMKWAINGDEAEEVHFGTLSLRWVRFRPVPDTVRPYHVRDVEVSGWAYVDGHRAAPQQSQFTSTVEVSVEVQSSAPPELPVKIQVNEPKGPASFVIPAGIRPPPVKLSRDNRSVRTSGHLVIISDENGRPLAPVEAHVGAFMVTRMR